MWVRPQPGAQGAPSAGPQVQELKWTDEDFAAAGDGQLPLGKHTDEWVVGDVEAGFKQADLVLDETFVGANTSHEPLEPRTAMAYWQNGKLYMHCSTQSTMRTIGAVARWVGIKPEEVVIISEYTGGGFGSKGSGTVFVVVPALLAKKTGAPVMMRITREQEQYIGRARPALHSRVKIGFRKDGRITALDGLAIVENGPYDVVGDARSAGDHISLSYQPMAMRWRGVSVLTNTPPRGAQRAPGGMQGNSLMAPIMAKAAHKLGIDQVAIHRINAPEGKAPFGGPNARGVQNRTTSAFLKEAIDKGAELFNWEARKARSGQRNGSKVRGLGMAVSAYSAGSVGFDGLFVIKPDGTMQIQSGIGNLGTESVFDVHRVAAEIVGMPWEKVEVVWGNTAKYLPSTCNQGGSQTTHAMTRAAHAAGMDAKKKLQEIAAKTLGGAAESYQVADGRVFSGGRSMTLAQAAKKAIELGGAYDGHELPERHQRGHESVGDRAGRAGIDGRRARQLSARGIVEVVRGRRLPKSKWMSRPAPTACWTCSPSPTSERSSIRAISVVRRSAASCSGWGMPSARNGSTTSTTACRSPGASIRHARRQSWTRRRRCDRSRSTSLIPRHRSARAASARRQSAPASAQWSTRSRQRSATTCSSGRRSRPT